MSIATTQSPDGKGVSQTIQFIQFGSIVEDLMRVQELVECVEITYDDHGRCTSITAHGTPWPAAMVEREEKWRAEHALPPLFPTKRRK